MTERLHVVEPHQTFNPGAEVYGDEMRRAEALAERFYKRGLEAYSQTIIGEDHAKKMTMALLAMGGMNGMAGVTIGPVGTAKSMVVETAEQLVEGIEPTMIAKVPHRQDLQPVELVGKTSEVKRSGSRDGQPYNESLTTKIVPILHPGVRVVKFDEISRTSPFALSAAVKIMQDGKITVEDKGEDKQISGFDLVLSSMNNYGTGYTNKLDPAIVSRHAMGAFVGSRQDGKLTEAGEVMWDNPNQEYTFEKGVSDVITLDELHLIRSAIKAVPLKQPERDLGKHLTAGMLDTMRDKGVEFGDGRLTRQLIRISQTLALMNAQKEVTERELREAVNYSLIAKLGMTGKFSPDEITKLADQL